MASDLPGFLRGRPRLAKGCVLGSLGTSLALAAFLGLQLQVPAQSRGELILEWAAFLLSLALFLATLLGSGRILRRTAGEGDRSTRSPS